MIKNRNGNTNENNCVIFQTSLQLFDIYFTSSCFIMYFKFLYNESLTEKHLFCKLAHRHLNHQFPLVHLHKTSSPLKFICFSDCFLT